jgi:phosphatidylglycerol lysyltransferase
MKRFDQVILYSLAFMMAISGLSRLYEIAETKLKLLEKTPIFFDAEVDQFATGISVALALFLVYLAMQLLQQKIIARRLSIVVLLILAGLHYSHYGQSVSLYISFATVVGLLLSRRLFYVRNDGPSLRRGLLVSAVAGVIAFIYGTIGFFLLGTKDFGQSFSLFEAASSTLTHLISANGAALQPLSQQANWFLSSIDIAGYSVLIISIFSLFRPIKYYLSDHSSERQKAKNIIDLYSNSPDDYFKIWPEDKQYFFGSTGKTVIAYRLQGNVAVVLGGVSGDKANYASAFVEFLKHCKTNGWICSVINAAKDEIFLSNSKEFSRISIGSEAIVDSEAFSMKTIHNKHFRYIFNKARQNKLEFKILEPERVASWLDNLENISNLWILHGKRREYGFAMGYFDRQYLSNCRIGIVLKNSKIIGYANLIPTKTKQMASIDHMRYDPDAPPETMVFLLAELIKQTGAENIKYFNLGLVPLSSTGETGGSSEKQLKVLIRSASKWYYSSAGLEQFKNKFKPDWHPRYLYYTGSFIASGAKIIAAINGVMKIHTKRRSYRYLIVLSIMAALGNSSFLLAPILGVEIGRLQFISDLAIKGASYSSTFIITETVGGISLIPICLYLYHNRQDYKKASNWLLAYLFIFGLFAALAAFTPLVPGNRDALNSILHEVYSFLSVTGLVFAALLTIKNKNIYNNYVTGSAVLFLASLVAWLLARNLEYGIYVQAINTILASIWLFSTCLEVIGSDGLKNLANTLK